MAPTADSARPAADSPPMGLDVPARLRTKDLLSVGDLSPDEILLVLDTAEAMKEVGTRSIKKVPALRGHTVVNLFFEPSTRTRTSFEIAEKRLSADTVNIAASGSSVSKGGRWRHHPQPRGRCRLSSCARVAGAGHLPRRLCGAASSMRRRHARASDGP